MDFRGINPGAVQFGNFINYYQFNAADDRVALFPDNVWLPPDELQTQEKPYLVLDVGCNAGNVTWLLLDYLSQRTSRPVRILAVDLDPMLIERAKEANRHPQQIQLKCVDIMKDEGFSVIKNYLQAHNAHKFDAVFCLAITMWIHLNHDDSGLREFLKKCSLIAELFVVEPQPWKCYQNADHRLKRTANETFPYFSKLEWRTGVEDEIIKYMQRDLERIKIHESGPTRFKRKILFYR